MRSKYFFIQQNAYRKKVIRPWALKNLEPGDHIRVLTSSKVTWRKIISISNDKFICMMVKKDCKGSFEKIGKIVINDPSIVLAVYSRTAKNLKSEYISIEKLIQYGLFR